MKEKALAHIDVEGKLKWTKIALISCCSSLVLSLTTLGSFVALGAGITNIHHNGDTMASYDVLKDIVRNGSNLVLSHSINYDVLRELASLASASGAKLTITTSINDDVIRELSLRYGKVLTFVDGLEDFKKE